MPPRRQSSCRTRKEGKGPDDEDTFKIIGGVVAVVAVVALGVVIKKKVSGSNKSQHYWMKSF